jgi:hypothetical protein
VQLNRRGVQVDWDGHGACRVRVSARDNIAQGAVSVCVGHAGTGSGRTPYRHQEGVTADTDKTLAVDVYAVVHLQRDADAHHLGVD